MPRLLEAQPQRLPQLGMRPTLAANSTVRTVLFRLDGAAATDKTTHAGPPMSAAQAKQAVSSASHRGLSTQSSKRHDALLNVRPMVYSCGKPVSAATASDGPEPTSSTAKREHFSIERLRELMPSPPSGETRDYDRHRSTGVLRSSLSDSYCYPSPRQNDGSTRLLPLPPRSVQGGPGPPRRQLYGSGDGDNSFVSSHLYAHNPLLLRPYIGAHHWQTQMPNGRHPFKLSAMPAKSHSAAPAIAMDAYASRVAKHEGASSHARKHRYVGTASGCNPTAGPSLQGVGHGQREKRRVKFSDDTLS